ncbi:Transcriptional-regulating factor 1 [Holothuria leucospilota]|uniref:Transcriptional-regulating factor 1 n=1 Tax=Holothuria leucospilota TaxID=206669 RepID=A0A9Q1CJE5_HOLLE|nr:Transcriptional-regulating factor 1 [Holothuria leucospilota]
MEGSMDELNTVKREASQVCAAVQRSTSLDSMPPPSNMSTLQFLNNGSSSSNNNSSTSAKADESSNNTLLPVMVNVNNSMPPGSQPCPVQRSRSLPLLDQSPLDTDDILAELANRANTGNNVSTVGDGIDPLSVETMAQQDGSLNGADDSGSNQDLNSVGSIPHQDYSTGPSTPTTPHHIPDQSKMSIHLNHQDLSPPPHSGHMPLQPLNLSQNIDSKLFSQSLPPNLFATLRPNQGSRDYLSQQQALPSNWSSGIPDSRFTFRNTEPFATYPGLSLAGLNQGRNSPFTTSYSLLRDGDKPPQFPPDVYNSIGIPQGLHFSRSLMQLQQAPFVRGQIPRDIEPTLEETVRVVSSIAGEPVENNNILKSTANVQQAFNEAVSNSLADKYTLSGNLSMSMPETSQGSPVTVGQKSNSPALRLKPMSDHMLSMINTYSEEQLLSESGNLMSNSPVMMDESFLTSAMNSGAMSRLQEAPNLPQVDNHSPSVNNEPFNLLDGSGDVEDTNFMPHGISPPQPPLGMDQAGATNANLLNYTSTSAAAHGDMKGHLPTGGEVKIFNSALLRGMQHNFWYWCGGTAKFLTCSLTLEAFNNNTENGLSSSVTFKVQVLDTIDTPPYFWDPGSEDAVPPRQELEVTENQEDNVVGTIAPATERDQDQEVYYFIVSGNEAGLFSLDAETGVLTTTDKIDIDDGITSYELIIKVTNDSDFQVESRRKRATISATYNPSSDPSLLTVVVTVIDTNNYPPVFTSNLYTADLSLNGVQIPVVPQTKFLGLILDSKLNFKAHIDYLRRKCQGALNLLKVVSKMDWGADRPVLLRLYRSLVRSKLDYGCVVYISAHESYLRKLLPVHNQGLRICLGAFRTSPMQSLYIEANQPPLDIRWKKLSLQFALKLRSPRHNPTFETTFIHKFSDLYLAKPTTIPLFAIRVREALSQELVAVTLVRAVIMEYVYGNYYEYEGNNNQQLSGSSPGDGPSKPKKGRPRAGAPGHRYSQPCPTCGKVFGSSSALAKHKLIHSSERRHKCILCAKSFKRQDHLTGHMLTHRSRKPYECTVDNCNKSYCDIRSLRRHFESQHPGMVMEDNMNYTGDEKDPELMRAEAAARQAQSQPFPSSASPQQQSDYIVNYATTTSPPTSVTNQESDSSSGSSSSAALQYLAQAAQRANTSTLSTLASVAAGQNLALANNQEPPEINLQEPPSSFASDISGHFLSSGNVPQSLPVSLGSIPSGSSGLTVSIPAPRIPEASMGGPSSGYQPPGMMSSPPKKTSTGKPSKQDKERTMVKCSICSKTFKSMPALNGHMRLHGGYNSSRTSTPPTSNQDQVKRPPKSLPSQVPSTFTPSSMDFSSGAYPHHMVMPQHNVSVPPSQPSSGPNMVSFVSSRYPPPENTYRSGMLQTAQQVIGSGHPAPMGHHLLQSSQLLQAHSRQLSDYNLVRPSTLSSSYPHSGLSSLSQAAIKLEAEAKNNCQLPDTSTALNLSAPKRNVITPSPPDLEAEVKYQCLDDSRHFMDRRIPMSSTQTSYSYQPPQGKVERDLEKDVFRDPTPVQVSPTKRKQRPPSLIIPAWATTGNPGGILPSAFQSQMRSPREIGPGFMYRTNSTTPPPYTPPPMLSPIRSGSGLYFSANSSGSNRVTTPAVPGPTPTTPSMLQFHRRTSTSGPAEETDLVFSSEPHINVGADFQAVIPELVHYFLDLACTPTLPGGARNTEFAYHCLQHAQGDIEIALMMLLNQKPLLPKNVHVNGYKYDFATPWSQSERKAFRDMYKAKGKDFHEIQKGIPTKTAKDCIEYYYFWKKLYPYNADMQKFCHHSGVTPNEEMRKQECDLFPDEVFLDYVPLKEYRSDKYGRCIEEEQKTNTTKPAASEKTTPKSDGPFLCSYPECQASFKSRQALNGHIRVHGGLYKGDKVAPKPKPRIPSASDSSEEEEEEDEDDNEEEMEEGARESTGEDASSSDEMSEDGTQNLYPCKICGKEFTKIKSRSAHMKSHRKVEEKNTPGPPLMSSETAADSQEEDPTVRPSISSMSDGDVDDYGMGWETESSSNNGQMEESMSSDAEMSD